MGHPAPPIASSGKASARARLVVARAGAAPARAGTVAALRPSTLPFAASGARFAGGGRGGGDPGGGGSARIAGVAVYPALRRPPAPAIKMSPFLPSYRGGAVLCLALRADGGGDGYGGAGAGGEGHGGGGVGAGGGDRNAKKDYTLKHGKDTEGAQGGGGGGAGDEHGTSGDDCAKKGCGFDHANGTEGAPAGGGGGAGDLGLGLGGETGVAGSGGDERNAEKACTFTKIPNAAAAAGGGGSDHTDQACWCEGFSVRWALIQALITAVLLGLSAYIALRLWFGTMVKKLATKLLKDEELRMLMAEAVKSVSYRATEPISSKLLWKKTCSTKFLYCGVFVCLSYYLLR